MKRDQDKGQHSPLEEDSSKRVHLYGNATSGLIMTFFQGPTILPSHIPYTLKEGYIDVFIEDLSFVQNIQKEEKMELLSIVTYQVTSLFSSATASRWDVLVVGIP